MSRSVFGVSFLLSVVVLSLVGAEEIMLGDNIYIGEPFQVKANVDDTVVVLNLNNPTKVYEFFLKKGETIELCFVRPCDHPCSCVPAERVIQATPGDEILFALKKSKVELRRGVQRSSPREKPKIEMELVGQGEQCNLKISVTYAAKDSTCQRDELSVSLFIHDEKDPIPLTLHEKGWAGGEFEGQFPLKLSYTKGQGKFIVTYDDKQTPSGKPKVKEVVLPNLPTVTVDVEGTKGTQKLVQPIKAEVLNVLPDTFRKGDCWVLVKERLAELVKTSFGPSSQIDVDEVQGKLYIVAQDGCKYFAGTKDVQVLPPVKLVVKDAQGKEVVGGTLKAGQKYEIEALHGQPDGCIIVVQLGPADKDKADCRAIIAKLGDKAEWTPGQEHQGKTFAVIYVDSYLCTPPALIFVVD